METRAPGRGGGRARQGQEAAGAEGLAEHILHLLEQAGHRLTEPRVQLVKAVAAWERQPFTGEDLYALLRSEEHTSELQSREKLVCRLLLEKKKRRRARRERHQDARERGRRL